MLARAAFLHAQTRHGMDIQHIPLFSLLSNHMSWLSARQSVLAENVSNADTPNYIARDLRPLDFAGILRDQAFTLKPAATNANHIAPRTGFQPQEAQGEGGSPNSKVSLEQEMIKRRQSTKADVIIGCPLCNTVQIPTTTNNQQ